MSRIITVSGSTSGLDKDVETIVFTEVDGTLILRLPPVRANDGRKLTIVVQPSTGDLVNIIPDGSDTIDNENSYALDVAIATSVQIQAVAAIGGWLVIGLVAVPV